VTPGALQVSGDPQGMREPVLSGRAAMGERTVEVRVACAGRIALRVAFANGDEPQDGAIFDRLVLDVAGGSAELSSCRYDAVPQPDGFAGRLIFLCDVYDFRALFFEGRSVSFSAAARSVPLMIGNREQVKPEFTAFVACAMYDFSVWRKFFDDQERSLAGEPADIAEAARRAMIASLRGDFFAFVDAHMADLAALVAGYTREEHERHGFYLRRQAWQFITASAFLMRTNLKPRGYAGDAEMMQMVYDNSYAGPTVFARLMHKHPIETAAAEAVRNRRRLVPRVLRDTRRRFASLPDGAFSFLSVAAGPASELEDIFTSREDCARMRCTLLDQDPHALAYARDGVARLERSLGGRLRVEWLQDSVRTMLRLPRATDRLGQHHFIYSMGLFDYLTTPVARATLARLYELLLPGATLVVGNYHVAMPCKMYMEYWADWRLLYRTEPEMLALAAELPGAKAWVELDSSGCQMFLHLEKLS
jgi:extracellular factor (EF) 3-hydroxypalmitic acid methyl ester biosynthesis protein